jgi:hypothetical protein
MARSITLQKAKVNTNVRSMKAIHPSSESSGSAKKVTR